MTTWVWWHMELMMHPSSIKDDKEQRQWVEVTLPVLYPYDNHGALQDPHHTHHHRPLAVQLLCRADVAVFGLTAQ